MVLVTVVKITIVACTCVGNLFVIVAILIDKNLQTAGNQLVLSLAVADLMVGCLVMPLGTYNDYHQGWWLGTGVCEFWTCADVLCCTASILNLLAIALDRYWAVTNVDYIYKRTWKRVTMMIVCAWTVGAVVSLAPIFGWKDPDFARRVLHDHKCLPSQDVGYQIFATISTFYAPLVLLLALYWRIFKVARKRIHCKPGRKSGPQQLVAAASGSILMGGGGGGGGGRCALTNPDGQQSGVKVDGRATGLRPDGAAGQTTESIARRGATASDAVEVAGRPDLERAGNRQVLAGGESNFKPLPADSIEVEDVGARGSARGGRVTNEPPPSQPHNGRARLKGGDGGERAATANRSPVGGAELSNHLALDANTRRPQRNDMAPRDSLNEKQICSPPGDRVAAADRLTGDASLHRPETRQAPATGNSDDQFLLSPKATTHRDKRRRANASSGGDDDDDELQTAATIIIGSTSERRTRRAPLASADDVLRLLQRCAEPIPLSGVAGDQRPASMAMVEAAAARLEREQSDRMRRWKQSGDKRRSLLQLDVRTLHQDLDYSRRSTSNSLSDCGYCCCCLQASASAAAVASGQTSGGLTSDDDEPGQQEDGRKPHWPQQAGPKANWCSSLSCNQGKCAEEAPPAWLKQRSSFATGDAPEAPSFLRRQRVANLSHAGSHLPLTTSMSVSMSSSTGSPGPSSSASSTPSSSSSDSSSRSMLAAAAAAELELALDEQIQLAFQFNDELRSSKPAEDDNKFAHVSNGSSPSTGDRNAARQEQPSAAAPEADQVGLGAQLGPDDELSAGTRSTRTSAIRRRFRALGQLVSFVQTSRQFNSSSSTQTSQSGDEDQQQQQQQQQQRQQQQQHRDTLPPQDLRLRETTTFGRDAESGIATDNGRSITSHNQASRAKAPLRPSGAAGGAGFVSAPTTAPAPHLTTTPATPSQAHTAQQQRRQNLEMKREKKAAKTLAIITGVFVCCWLPFFLNAIVMPICGELCTPSDPIQSVLLWLGYLNSLLNPIIYTIFSPDFRRAFHRLLYWPEARARTAGASGLNKKPASGSGAARSSSELNAVKLRAANGAGGARKSLRSGKLA